LVPTEKEQGHKGLTVQKRRWNGLEFNNGIKERGAKRQLCLGKERPSGRIFRKTVELEIEKRIVGSLTALQEMSGWTLWWGRPLQNERNDVKNTSLVKEIVAHL
jgi:hypothetical protein